MHVCSCSIACSVVWLWYHLGLCFTGGEMGSGEHSGIELSVGEFEYACPLSYSGRVAEVSRIMRYIRSLIRKI